MTITLSALQKQRRDTAANWTAENPTLLAGEIGIESDTGYWKVGDGSTAWTSLAYVPALGAKVGVPDGTAAAPAVFFADDTNTGIYSPGADQVALSTGGTGRLFVNASGRVGVGTASPAVLLSVATAASGEGLRLTNGTNNERLHLYTGANALIEANNSNLALTARDANSVILSTTNTERLRITSDGKVGLGTSAPVSLLHLASTGNPTLIVQSTDSFSPRVDFIRGSSGSFGGDATADWRVQNNGGNFTLEYGLSSTISERLRIDTAGRVGVGTTSPTETLTIAGTTQDVARIKTTAVNAKLYFEASGTTNSNYIQGTGNELLVVTNGAERARIDSSGRLGLGTSSPGALLELQQNSATALRITRQNGVSNYCKIEAAGSNSEQLTIETDPQNAGAGFIDFRNGAASKLRITSTGVGVGTTSPSNTLQIVDNGGTTGSLDVGPTANQARIYAASDGIRFGSVSNHDVIIRTNNTERLRIDSSGRLGIGTSSPQAQLDVAGTGSRLFVKTSNSALALAAFNAAGNAAADMVFETYNKELGRFDSSGRLLVGTSTARTNFNNTTQSGADVVKQIIEGADGGYSASLALVSNRLGTGNNASLFFAKSNEAALGSNTLVSSDTILGNINFQGSDGSEFVSGGTIRCEVDGTPGANDMPGRLVFSTTADGASSPTERMRISSSGHALFNKTARDYTIVGAQVGSNGEIGATVSSNTCFFVNRLSSDGTLVKFFQNSNEEGNISVSGTTVSYNGAHLSRWSQIPGIDSHDKAARPEILRGTVMSNLDDMCDWVCPTSGDCQDNEQLNKTKISDVEGDKNVAGVFQSWDNDDDTWVNDFYLAMTGDFIIRIGAGVTVERGDLLMSAGDGTAKPQGDGYVQDKTIAKVTSTNVSCTYDDGSYCVPCVLMAC